MMWKTPSCSQRRPRGRTRGHVMEMQINNTEIAVTRKNTHALNPQGVILQAIKLLIYWCCRSETVVMALGRTTVSYRLKLRHYQIVRHINTMSRICIWLCCVEHRQSKCKTEQCTPNRARSCMQGSRTRTVQYQRIFDCIRFWKIMLNRTLIVLLWDIVGNL